jgi:hypothetical protein
MNELIRVCDALRATRPSLGIEQLLALEGPSAEFEQHIPAETGRDFWVYSIDGKTLDGDVIVVRAALPVQAETLAQQGLADTIRAARDFDANTGLQAEVEVRGVH